MITAENISAVLERISNGDDTKKACRNLGIDNWEFWKVINADSELGRLYAQAKEKSADHWAQVVIDAAMAEPERGEDGKIDQGDVANRRLRVDALKWIACKLKPRTYGDKIQAEVSGPGGTPIQVVTGVKDAVVPLPLSGPGLGSVDAD